MPAQTAEPADVLCPACSALAGDGDRFCAQCGQDLGTAAACLPGDVSAPQPSTGSGFGQPAIDKKVGAVSTQGGEENTILAPVMHTPGPEVHETDCPCGQVLPKDALFCQRCGKPVSQNKPRCRLTLMKPDRQGESVAVSGDEFTIGKSPESGLALQDDYVSRRHARLTASNGMLFLEDLGSSNGTFLRVRRPIVLEAGDEILIGSTVLKVEDISN